MKGVRYFALILGIVYLLVGLMGFIPSLLSPAPADAPPLTIDTLSGYLLGLFAVNVLHTVVHVLVGIWGILAYRSYSASRTFSRTVAILFGLLTIMGLIPGLNTTFGLIPLHGPDVGLHALTALLAAYFGFVAPAEEPSAMAY
jgi:hypothetical protein